MEHVSELLARIVGVQVLHQLVAVRDVDGPWRYRDLDAVSKEERDIVGSPLRAGDLLGDVDGKHPIRSLGQHVRQATVARAYLEEGRARANEPREHSSLRRHGLRVPFRIRFTRQLRMIRDGSEEFVVDFAVEAPSRLDRGTPQAVGQCALDLVVRSQAFRRPGVRAIRGPGAARRIARGRHAVRVQRMAVLLPISLTGRMSEDTLSSN